jgi:hypothetical protein
LIVVFQNRNQSKSHFEAIAPGSALSEAFDEISELVKTDLQAQDSDIPINEGGHNKLTLLFSFAVLRKSFAGILDLVSTMLTLRISLSSSAAPFLKYFNR